MRIIDRQAARYNYTHDILIHHSTEECGCFDVTRTIPWNVLLCAKCENRPPAHSFVTDLRSGMKTCMNPGTWCLIPKNRETRYSFSTDTNFLNLQYSAALYPGIDLFEEAGESFTGSDPSLVRRLTEILNQEDDALMLFALKAELALFSLRLVKASPALNLSDSQRELLRHMNRNISATLTVNALADSCGMSQPAFSRMFSETFGKSPKEYLDGLLIQKILVILHTTGLPLREIARKFGFSSEFALSRFVKRITGTPPTLHRSRGSGSL